jgi:putative flippase GtrA
LVLRFGLAGLLNTAFGYAVFAALIFAGAGPFLALTLATLGGVAFNFQTSRRLVFRAEGGRVRFVAAYAAVLLLNWAALRLLRHAGLPSLQAQALLALPVAATSFAAQRLFVFRGAAGQA